MTEFSTAKSEQNRSPEGAWKSFVMLKIWLIVLTVAIVANHQSPAVSGHLLPWDGERVVRDFVQPIDRYSKGHRGIDVAFDAGAAVPSPASGRVSHYGVIVNRSTLTITTDSNHLISLEPICSDLEVGDEVKFLEPVGQWCAPDETYIQHCDHCIHISARDYWGYLSPELFFGTLSPSQLKS